MSLTSAISICVILFVILKLCAFRWNVLRCYLIYQRIQTLFPTCTDWKRILGYLGVCGHHLLNEKEG